MKFHNKYLFPCFASYIFYTYSGSVFVWVCMCVCVWGGGLEETVWCTFHTLFNSILHFWYPLCTTPQ